MSRWAALAAALILGVAVVACGGDDDDGGSDPTGTEGASPGATGEPTGTSAAASETGEPQATGAAEENALLNPGFEEDDVAGGGWEQVGASVFEITDEQAASGSRSLHLSMRDDTSSQPAKSYAVGQRLGTSTTPELLQAAYRVENWVKGTAKQYIVATVIVIGGTGGFPPCPDGNLCPNYQIRYILGGVAEEPLETENARYVFVSKDEPVQGEWVRFQRNLRNDFEDIYGHIPEAYEEMRLIFELRYDDRAASEGPLEGDLYIDDVYAGPAG
jgi:hypothetical protein